MKRRAIDPGRRAALVALAATTFGPGARATTKALRVGAAPFTEPIAQIAAGERGTLLAVGRGEGLWQITPGEAAARRLAEGFDAGSPLAIGPGRIAGRQVDGSLAVLEDGRIRPSAGITLAAGAGLLVLQASIIAIEAADGSNRPLRAEIAGDGRWRAMARGDWPVLPDARPLQAALEGETDGGHVVLLGGPDSERYPHGVLGDAVEATRIVYLERHRLAPLRELVLPATDVFEDIAPRRVVHAGREALLSIVSGPTGGRLVLVGADPADPHALAILARGEPIGVRFRWLAPSTDGRFWLAVHTPHLGGPLVEYRPQGERLIARRVATGLSNHRLGSRVLDMASWQGGRVLMPEQTGTRLRLLDGRRDWALVAETSLPSAVVASVAMMGSDRHAVLLQDGQVFFVEARG
jgi:hypothetical protein